MLETVREFSLERLAAEREDDVARRAHAAHFLALATAARPRLEGPDRAATHDLIEREHDNLRAALAWAIGREEAELAQGIAGETARFWMDLGHIPEGRRWLDQAIAVPGDVPVEVRVEALYWASAFAIWDADLARAQDLGERALAVARAGHYAFGQAMACYILGNAAVRAGDLDRADALFEETLRRVRPLNEPAWALAWIGLALDSLGATARARGDLARAGARFEEALAVWRQADHPWGVPLGLSSLADFALAGGDYRRALGLFQECLARRWDLRDRFHVAGDLQGIARVLLAAGQAAPAAALLGTADVLIAEIGRVPLPSERAQVERDLAAARTLVGAEDVAAAWSAGRATPLKRAVAEALAVAVLPAESSRKSAAPHGLSSRQREVLRLIAAGQSNAQIAAALGISRRTVTTHATAILNKLGLSSRAELIAFAIRHDLA
jgi:non-specific serine/threonine protein kinase